MSIVSGGKDRTGALEHTECPLGLVRGEQWSRCVRGEQWSRCGRRSGGARFNFAGFGRCMMHDPVHHLFDVAGHRGE